MTPPPGFDVAVSPTTLKLGGTGTHAKYTVTFTRTTAPLDFSSGSLTWSDGQHSVPQPARGEADHVPRPAAAHAQGAEGEYDAPRQGRLRRDTADDGPWAGARRSILGDADEPDGGGLRRRDYPATNEHVAKFTVTVPGDAQLARFETHDSDLPPQTDIDMYVYKAGTTELKGSSAGPTGEESVELSDGEPGDYDVYVDLFSSGFLNTQVVLYAISALPGWNLTVTPSTTSVQAGQTVKLKITWSGLPPGGRLTPGGHYFGTLSYSDLTSTLGTTQVEANG